MNKISVWINAQYMEWEKSAGRRGTVSGFARFLDVKQPSLSRWMNGDADPEGDNLRKLSKKYGDEVYEILGLPKPDEIDLLSVLPPERSVSLRAALTEVNETLLKCANLSDAETLKLTDEIMARHGWRTKVI